MAMMPLGGYRGAENVQMHVWTFRVVKLSQISDDVCV